MNDSRAVAVVGGTGFLGRPVVERLVAQGSPVRALSRDAGRAREVLPAGCEVVEVDFDSRDGLRRALDGCRAVHLNLSPPDREDQTNPEVEVSLRVAAAVPGLGVERLTKISFLGVQEADASGEPVWWAIRTKAEADRAVVESGVPWTIFRPDWFLESLAFFGSPWMVLPPRRPEALHWIAAADYARQVVASLDLPQAADRFYDVQGPEALTFHQAARRWAEAKPERVRRVTLPRPVMAAGKLVSGDLRYLDDLLAYTYRWTVGFRAEDTWRDLGKPSLTVEDVARGGAPATAEEEDGP